MKLAEKQAHLGEPSTIQGAALPKQGRAATPGHSARMNTHTGPAAEVGGGAE